MVLYSNESEHFLLSNFHAIFIFSILSQIFVTPTMGGESKILKNCLVQISRHLWQFGTLLFVHLEPNLLGPHYGGCRGGGGDGVKKF